MPNFEFKSPDGKTYSVQGPEGATAEQAFQMLQSQLGGGNAAPAAPAAPEPAPAAPVTTNNVVRSTATGVPIVGGLLNKLDAATNASLAPLLNRFFDPKDQLGEENWSDRYAHSLRDQEGADKKFGEEHPIVDTAAQLAGGVASMVPVMSAAPKAFGVTGKLSEMVKNGAISGAAVSGADAITRGHDPLESAAIGGVVGGAAGPVGKAVGKGVAAIADRINPKPAVPRNVQRVGDVEIPLTEAEATGNTALSAEQQIMLRGGRGDRAQQTAEQFRDLQGSRLDEARNNITSSFDPTGATARTSPNEAAERVAAELIAAEQARAAADRANVAAVGTEGQSLARGLDRAGTLRAPTAFDAGEQLSERFGAARDAAKADYRGKYKAVGEQPGDFAPGSAAGFRDDVDASLRAGENPVSLDPTNTPRGLRALDIIDENLNAGGPNAKPRAPAPAPSSNGTVPAQKLESGDHAATVEAIRAKFGDDVAAAYDRQKSAMSGGFPGDVAPAAEQPKAQSLLEFLASKGGLGPDAELEALGGHGHTVNVEGVGRRKLVRQGGWPLDYAREAAEEAGYLQGNHAGTSTVNDLLDAIDAEIRGQKRFPAGHEGHVSKREASAMSEREQHEFDRHMAGLEEDLAAAGHGDLGPDVKKRAVKLMADERMTADDAVEHALHQLETEDAAAAATRGGDFLSTKKPAQLIDNAGATGDFPSKNLEPGAPFTMRDVEQVRKQLSTLYGDARRAMMGGGSGADLHALEAITDAFDARVEQMVASGKFAGDGPAVLQMMRDARAAFSDYKQKFAKRGSGDTIGAAVEKILGKFSDTKATPDEVVRLAYGSGATPGGQMPVQIAQRIERIFGKDSAEFSTYKQGLYARLREGEAGAAADRIDDFLTGTKGKLLSQVVFSKDERARLAQYANRLRSTLPRENDPGAAAAAIRRYVGADGAPAASPRMIVRDLMGASGKGEGVNGPLIAAELKKRLSPEGWAQVRTLAFKELTEAGEGKIAYEAQALSQRLHEFLNESGAALAKTLYSPRELEIMKQLAAVYKQMIPAKGTTNPSGTAPMLAKMAGGLRSSLLPLLGLTHGGLPGAAAAIGVDKGLAAIGNARQARKATQLFYGGQEARPVDGRFSKLAGLLAQGSRPNSNQRR